METFLELARRRGVSGSELVGLTTAAEAEGLRGYWRWQLARLQAPTAGEPMLIAEALAALGDRDAALPWLQMASRRRGGWFLHLMKSPAFDALRADPRFQSLVESTKAPPVTPSNPG